VKEFVMPATTSHHGILVGVDGSPDSDAAVRWAVTEALMRGLPLSIVHVISPIAGHWRGVGMSGAVLPEDLGQWLEEEGQLLAEDAVGIAREAAGGVALQIRTELPSAAVVPTLIDLSKQSQMVVVGSSGKGALRRALLGSVSTGLIHHAHCPIAVVHGAISPEHRAGPVVVGIDGSTASERATALAFEEASLRNVELVALHAWCDTQWPERNATKWSVASGEAERALAEHLVGWQRRHPDVTVRRIVVRDRPAANLIAESEFAQLVVVGSHGRGGFGGMLLGSVSCAVAQGIHTPLIVARHD
jgi:nucleotide-binding universal stress UspA family protein